MQSGRSVSCDVLVVGGGISGCATAYELARAGADVHLVERFDLNTQGSGYNAGSLHAQLQHEPFQRLGEDWARAYAPATRFLADSIERWRALPDEIGGVAARGSETVAGDDDELPGGDLEIAIRGGILVAETEAQLRDVERKVAIEREQGLDVELLGRDELRAVAPYVSERMLGGELCRNEGKANPLLAAPAFARAARRHGAQLSLRTELLGLARERAGFVARTSGGQIACRRVVSCGGVDAGRVTAMLGVDLPVEGFAIQAAVTEPVAPLVRHLVYFAGEALTLKQAAVGSVLIGGGWPARVDSGTGRVVVDEESLRANLRVACKVVPAIARLRLLRTWAGYVNALADWRPIIGEIERVPGLYVGVFPWMGFTAGPLLGAVLADLVLGRPANRDLAPFSPGRF